MTLPQASLWLQSWVATADAITTVSTQQMLGPGSNRPLGLMSLLHISMPTVCILFEICPDFVTHVIRAEICPP